MRLLPILFLSLLFFQGKFAIAGGGDSTKTKLGNEQKRLESLEKLFPKDRINERTSEEAAGMAISEWLVSDDIFRERLALLSNNTPFDLVYNEKVKSYIKLYAIDKKHMTARLLGLSNMYFPLFEEVLQKYDMPDELKYLAVIESALHAKAKSHAAAVGLWQFIPSTGKMFGLKINSHLDERSDPIKATHAACLYLKSLYGIFGNWEMALAAYNSGPGTVNKAIRNSGGKRSYWEIYDYLPRETRSYVPAFIAVNYTMNYYKEHGIVPVENQLKYFDFDTIMLTQNANLSHIAAIIDEPLEILQFLNPSLKTNNIPASSYPFALTIPKDKIGVFAQNRANFKNYASENLATIYVEEQSESRQVKTYHKVRKGENLSELANKYNCSVNELRSWNKLKSNRIALNQKLIVYRQVTGTKTIRSNEKLLANNDLKTKTLVDSKDNKTAKADSPQTKSPGKELTAKSKVHIVQRGDTLWSIAKRYEGITVDELKKMNNLNGNNLKLGQKIIVSAGV